MGRFLKRPDPTPFDLSCSAKSVCKLLRNKIMTGYWLPLSMAITLSYIYYYDPVLK